MNTWIITWHTRVHDTKYRRNFLFYVWHVRESWKSPISVWNDVLEEWSSKIQMEFTCFHKDSLLNPCIRRRKDVWVLIPWILEEMLQTVSFYSILLKHYHKNGTSKLTGLFLGFSLWGPLASEDEQVTFMHPEGSMAIVFAKVNVNRT